jgi:hypothetical protein
LRRAREIRAVRSTYERKSQARKVVVVSAPCLVVFFLTVCLYVIYLSTVRLRLSGLPYGESEPIGAATPSAYYYDGRTYVTWQGVDLAPYVAYYTSATGMWTGPVRVGNNPLTNDDHGCPAIMVDNSGYIYITYGAHDSALKFAKSTSPENISAWTVMSDPTSQATYPYLLKDASGNIWLLYRTSRVGDPSDTDLVETIVESTNRGLTWSAPHDLINMYEGDLNDRVYVLGGVAYDSANKRVDLAWSIYDDLSGQRKKVYYAYFDLASGSMFSISGRNLGLTIDKMEADTYCMIASSGTGEADFIRLHIDSSQKPYLIYDASSAGSWEYNFTRWTGASWSTPVTIRSAGDSDGNEFFIDSASSITAYLVNPVSGRGGDIEQWSWNGSTWTKVSTVLAQSQVSYPLNQPMQVVNGADLKIVFCEINIGTGQYTISNLRIFACGGSGLGPGLLTSDCFTDDHVIAISTPVSAGAGKQHVFSSVWRGVRTKARQPATTTVWFSFSWNLVYLLSRREL